MFQKLSEHLAKKGEADLKPFLGASVVELLMHVGHASMTPQVMATLLITSQGAPAVLRNPSIRRLLIEGLDEEEVRDLCSVLHLSTEAPRHTLSQVNFELPAKQQVFFNWYAVPFEPIGAPVESSRNVASPVKLSDFQTPAYRRVRALLGLEKSRLLVHMPFGAGKLRTVTTALLETFRAEPESKSVLWLAPGECLCEEAMTEIETVWRQLGLRDLTSFRLYGGRGALPIAPMNDGIVVADVATLARDLADPTLRTSVLDGLRALGGSLRHVVLSDAEHALAPAINEALDALQKEGDWNLVGISASPSLAIEATTDPQKLLAAYDGVVVELDHDDPLAALQKDGEVDPIDIVKVRSPIGALEVGDDWIELPARMAESIASDVERNKMVIDLLAELSNAGHRVVYYAATAHQARMFAGLLTYKGISAAAVTSELEPHRRTLEMIAFSASPMSQVLCAHDVLVSSSQVRDVNACVLGMPTVCGAVIHEMVGRLATGRNSGDAPLKVYAIRDPIPGYLRLVDSLDLWDRLKI